MEKKIIVFDVETTGVNPDVDEILQLSIIDSYENVLFNSYLKPYFKKEWLEAENVHGITPADVASAPYPHEVADEVRAIIEGADIHITYNGAFDKKFLSRWNINFEYKQCYDVMIDFAPIFGEWNEYFGSYKWQKLEVCAEYYGYKFKAHDSLEDVKATLFCWKKMLGVD